jgi:hypothetical protein
MTILRRLFATRITAQQLADLLYMWVTLRSWRTFLKEEGARFNDSSGFQPEAKERLVFVYIVASIAIALTKVYESQPRDSRAIEAFREKIRGEMAARWHYSPDEADEVIQGAADDLATLLFRDPEDRGISFEWAGNWLKKVGVNESNPITLLKVSLLWESEFGGVGRLLSEFRIADRDPSSDVRAERKQCESTWKAKMEDVDFNLAKNTIARMFKVAGVDAEQRGGEHVIKQEFNDVLEPFMSRPCLENAIKLLEFAPFLYPCFEWSRSRTQF